MKELIYWICENKEKWIDGVSGVIVAILTILFFANTYIAMGISALCMIIVTIFHGWDF